MVDPDSPSSVKEDSNLEDSTTVECSMVISSAITTAQAVKSSSPSPSPSSPFSDYDEGVLESSSVLGKKRPSYHDSDNDNFSKDKQLSSETKSDVEEVAKNVDKRELSTRRQVKAKLGTIDTTFNLADSKSFPAPNSTPRSIGQTPRSVNSEDDSFFQERMTLPTYNRTSIYEKANPFKSSLSIGIPKSPAKSNPYAGQSPNGNPFVIKSPHSTCSSNNSSKVSPRSNFNFPNSINSNNSSPRPTFNGFLDLRSKSSPSVHTDTQTSKI